MVCLCRNQMIDHIRCGCKERFDTGLRCSIGNALGQKALTDSRITNQYDVLLLFSELQGSALSR